MYNKQKYPEPLECRPGSKGAHPHELGVLGARSWHNVDRISPSSQQRCKANGYKQLLIEVTILH